MKHSYYFLGVNSFLDAASADPTLLPPEFKEYSVPFPAPFSPIDAFLTTKALSVGLSGNAKEEVPNQEVVQKTSLERFFELQERDHTLPYCLPPYHHSTFTPDAPPSPKSKSTVEILPFPENIKLNFTTAKDECERQKYETLTNFKDSELAKFLTSFASSETRQASNNWVVSGQYTDTGLPLVCNDPHLPYTAPMVWFLVGLNVTNPTSPWREIVGATIICAPGIGVGRNPFLAWGFTTDHADTQDLYIMQNSANNTQYYYNSTWHDYQSVTSTVLVKNQSSVTQTFLYSVYGPVLTDNDNNYYSVTYTAFNSTDTSLQALMDSNIATNLDEWRTAMSKWWSLLFNAAYGDTNGNICLQAVGAIPQRKPGNPIYNDIISL